MDPRDQPSIPHSLESEIHLIGALMFDGNETMKKISHIVTHQDFYDKRHAVIFRAAEKLYREKKIIDLITVSDFLQLKGYLDQVGGSAYLSQASDDIYSTAKVVHYARVVADRAVLRRIINASSKIIDKARHEDDLDQFLLEAEATLKGVTRSSARAENKLAVVDAEDWRKIARDSDPPEGQVRGLSSGYKALDDVTEGFEGGEMYILTGHTGHGKSQLATNWAVSVAQRGHNVLFINTEMTKLQMGRRLNSILGDEELKGKIELNDRADIDHRDVVAIMEGAKERGCDMVVVDHLHYFARSEDNATGQVSKMTKEFKDAAVTLEIPLLMLCHIDQSKPETVRPTLKMLKNSSSIAQDADLVLTVFRNEDKNPGVLEIIRLKGRSNAGKNKYAEVYYSGLKLVQSKPATPSESPTFYDNTAKLLGEKDEDDLYIPADWSESKRAGEDVWVPDGAQSDVPAGNDDAIR